MLKKIAISAVLTCAALPAFASDWVTITNEPDHQLSVDTASIVRQGPTVKAWIRRVNTPPKNIPNVHGKVSEVKTVWVFNCQEKTMHIGALIATDDKGETVESVSDHSNSWSEVVPDTLGDSVMQGLCKGQG
jgi:hypothetical protein